MNPLFYLSAQCIPDLDDPQAWLEPKIVPFLNIGHCRTAQNWIYQSFIQLKQRGIPLELYSVLPPQGMILALGSSLSKKLRIPAGMCLIDIVADAAPNPAAHAYIVQNRIQQKYIPHSFFIPHWPQPKMIPRSPDRGDRFDNIAFFGDINSLAPELRKEEWHHHLRRTLGLSFTIKSPYQWHNYSDVDGVIAIRSFSQSCYLSKSAVKLYNAWLAGVPFIGGRDVAYADEGHPGKNYLIATSPSELLEHLRHLKEDISFRRELIAHGHHQGAFYTQEKTAERWISLIQGAIGKFAHTQVRKTLRQCLWMRQQHRFYSWVYQQRARLDLFEKSLLQPAHGIQRSS